MKGLSSSRSHHHTVICDPSYDSLIHHPDRKPYLLNPVDTHPADHPYYAQRNSIQTECMMPYNDQLASSTFPRRHYNSHHELKNECALVPHGIPNKGNHMPANLLEQIERQIPISRDGYHTLQYKRTAVENRSDSPGRIRHLVHSVQKLFTKSHSLEGPSKGSINGNKASPDEPPTVKNGKRSKSKDRGKIEMKPRSNIAGWWSSDDKLDNDVCLYHGPAGIMTMGRCPDRSTSQYLMEAYNNISEHTLKTSRSNNDVKCTTCASIPINMDAQLMKKSSWSSTLTVSRAREVYQKASVNVDKTVMKSETCQQERSCQYLQVPQDEWTGFTSLGKDDEIPCRRMRSGSYIKAMADDDSGESDTSPKPSPKIQARRASYLKATQPSLTEMTTLKISTEHSPKLQIRSHSYLRAVSEVSINRSLDSLDPAGLLTSPKFRSRNESYMRAMSTISQVSEVEVNGQFESVCESVFSEMESQAVDALDLPMPGCFRMRSHSYVRAIEKGCSQDDECVSLRTASPPRTTTTVRTIQSSTVSSCITTYKKTPPPAPPRTTTKPFISITAQSSTESAQDAYMDGQGQRGDISQSGLSNSTESIDSMKALTAAIEAANAQVHGPASQHVSNSTVTITSTSVTASETSAHLSEESKKEVLRKSKCLSIGIQVDGPDDSSDVEENSHFSNKFQSVGIQVEEERCSRRFTRSNSVTAAVQADIGEVLVGLVESPETDPPSSGSVSRQFSRDASTSTVSIQGSGNHYHACAVDDEFDAGFDPSILPPPDPWIDTVTEDPMEVVQRSVCHRDGGWFLKLLQAETDRMEGWCQQMERDERENDLPDEVLGKIRSAVGSAQLLISKKFQQFRELCEENLNPNAHPLPTSQDLAGFWDMLQLSIENISLKFEELHQLKANNWKPLAVPKKKERRLPPPVPKKPPKGYPPLARDRSLESTEKQRQEARKRLMAAKRAASVRQNSATESADSIEIYIPEAQTRL
ncbi:disks large-associated protein 1-like isoform X1 [Polyodon spathula]|uniref:disks large-associated protein 1-like isoform X1 n=1 Tax=Polyodon spathula TaxID=7913 RepID=UPI001B7EE331|nr:disks large-associated protein 1-like isoform X1 [Polyodon spathula]XP_041103776.1 disks large-associated protein 1-like isoform X1 [Polyodon spathula]